MAETARLKLPLLSASQAQKHVTHNEALALLDFLANGINVQSRALSTPAGGESDGQAFILNATGTGAWLGYAAGDVALMLDGGWRRLLPAAGMVATIVAEAGATYRYTGAAWSADVAIAGALKVSGPAAVGSYTVAGLPPTAAAVGQIIYVSNEAGGAVLAFSDGAAWRRVTDRAVVS